ncbi:Inner membrane protein YidH [Mycobacteroides salmoniphilum]|uniref:Inner membrane protein YidH n=1 Tax=Mycobacteroides salmoniphilum TaxID=404941 RepID=A0A4R8SJ38_9MYCO|nr:Inner membrane protein YidH [Mycobacteroides salmoniphilum]TEA01497.1 Inner membrane protein YidH [Mycobacteroides salmoniphilum]
MDTEKSTGPGAGAVLGKLGGVTEPPEDPEIDYRFTLANERTFLSWIRTALGLLAGGVAVQTLVQPFHHAGVRHVLAASCLALAVVVSIGAYVHWRDVKERMDRDQPLKGTLLVPLLAVSIGLVAILASIAVFYR